MTFPFTTLDVTLASVPEVSILPNPVKAFSQNLWYYNRSQEADVTEGCNPESWPIQHQECHSIVYSKSEDIPHPAPQNVAPEIPSNTFLASLSASLLFPFWHFYLPIFLGILFSPRSYEAPPPFVGILLKPSGSAMNQVPCLLCSGNWERPVSAPWSWEEEHLAFIC